MQLLEVPSVLQGDSAGYFLRGSDDSTYLPGRSAEIVAYGTVVGRLGVLHPETLSKFELNLPISAMEINLELFLWASEYVWLINYMIGLIERLEVLLIYAQIFIFFKCIKNRSKIK